MQKVRKSAQEGKGNLSRRKRGMHSSRINMTGAGKRRHRFDGGGDDWEEIFNLISR